MSGHVIDYALARDVDVHTSAGEYHGSDHRVVVFDCLRGRRRLRVGLWNMQRDRPADKVLRQVLDVIKSHRLDVLLLCESSDYVRELAQLRGWRLRTGYAGVPGSRETAILVRENLELGTAHAPRLNRAGWITVRGGRTAPKYCPTVVVDGWLRVAVVHTPPSCRFRGGGHGPVGPVRRVAAYVGMMRRLRLFVRRHRGPLLIAADWNATPAARGPFSPHWLARTGRLRVCAPKIGTHR